MVGILVLIIITVSFIMYLSGKNKIANQPQNQQESQQPPNPASGGSGSGTGSGSGSGSGNSGSGSGSSAEQSSSNAILTKITNDQAVGPSLSYDGQAIWYFTPDGHLYKENLGTGLKQEKLLPSQIAASAVIWPQAGNDFILESDSSAGKSFYYYNSSDGSFTRYPPQVKEVDFMPDGKTVAYDWSDNSGSYLSVANSDLTQHQTIVKLPDKDEVVKVSPTSANMILAYNANDAQSGKLYYIKVDAKTITAIKTGESDQAEWAPDGIHFLYYKLNAKNPSDKELWLGNIQQGTDQALGIDVPLSKAVFSGDSSDLYFAASGSSGDSIWKMDLQNLSKSLAYSSQGNPVTAENLLLSSDSGTLYFINSDGYIYSVNLSLAQRQSGASE